MYFPLGSILACLALILTFCARLLAVIISSFLVWLRPFALRVYNLASIKLRFLPMYKFYGFDNFLKFFSEGRQLLLAGQKGTGKTLFSVALGYEMLKRGTVINSSFNFPVCFGTAVSNRYNYAVIDEAGIFIDSRFSGRDKEASSMAAMATALLRKRGNFLVVPSFISPDKRYRMGVRMYRYRVGFRGKLWLYFWEYGQEEPENRKEGLNYFSGRLGLWNPQFFYGAYDTRFEPSPDYTREFLRRFIDEPTLIPRSMVAE